MVAFLRSIFGEHVLIHPMLKSTAISDAGLTNQTIFEVERQQFTKSTYDRALESVNNVSGEIEGLIREAWGRAESSAVGLRVRRRRTKADGVTVRLRMDVLVAYLRSFAESDSASEGTWCTF
jgi:hypothetical protein